MSIRLPRPSVLVTWFTRPRTRPVRAMIWSTAALRSSTPRSLPTTIMRPKLADVVADGQVQRGEEAAEDAGGAAEQVAEAEQPGEVAGGAGQAGAVGDAGQVRERGHEAGGGAEHAGDVAAGQVAEAERARVDLEAE